MNASGSNHIKIFEAIRDDDFETVKNIITTDPSAINAIAPKRPLDTRGMSPLQVSLCTGRHKKIAWLLLESGANVNYIPDKKWAEEARPVLFDGVNAAVWNARRYSWDGKSPSRCSLNGNTQKRNRTMHSNFFKECWSSVKTFHRLTITAGIV